jgi:cysteine desulfurase
MRRMTHGDEIYCDANATHPLLPSVRTRLTQVLNNESESLGNPSSVHITGQRAKKTVFELKNALAEWLGAKEAEEFILCSGATEAINLAIRGFVRDIRGRSLKPVLLATRIEHAAVLDTLADLKDQAEIHLLEVDSSGQFSIEELLNKIDDLLADPNAALLLCLQLANNECGSTYDFSFLPEYWKRFGPKSRLDLPKLKGGTYPKTPQRVWLFLDAVQALGKMPEDFIRRALHYADYCVLSSHKIGGPTGIGALWLRGKSPFAASLTGGSQEKKRRAGTHNILGIHGFLAAVQDWRAHGDEYRKRLKALREKLLLEIKSIPNLHLHALLGDQLPALPNTINFHVDDCEEDSLVIALDLGGVRSSSGSACHSGSLKASPVLLAMGYSEDIARSSLRISLHHLLSDKDIEVVSRKIIEKIDQVRKAKELAHRILPRIEIVNEAR